MEMDTSGHITGLTWFLVILWDSSAVSANIDCPLMPWILAQYVLDKETVKDRPTEIT